MARPHCLVVPASITAGHVRLTWIPSLRGGRLEASGRLLDPRSEPLQFVGGPDSLRLVDESTQLIRQVADFLTPRFADSGIAGLPGDRRANPLVDRDRPVDE